MRPLASRYKNRGLRDRRVAQSDPSFFCVCFCTFLTPVQIRALRGRLVSCIYGFQRIWRRSGREFSERIAYFSNTRTILEALSLLRRHDCNCWKRCRCSDGTIAIPGSAVAAAAARLQFLEALLLQRRHDCNCWKRCRCSDGTNAIAGSAVAAEKKGGLPGGSVFLESGGHLRKVFCRRFSLRKIRGPTSWKYISRVWMPSVQSLL